MQKSAIFAVEGTEHCHIHNIHLSFFRMELLSIIIERNFLLLFIAGVILVALVLVGSWLLASMLTQLHVKTRDIEKRMKEAHRRLDALPCVAHLTMIAETRELAERIDGKMDVIFNHFRSL